MTVILKQLQHEQTLHHRSTGCPLALNFFLKGIKSWPFGMYFCSSGGTLAQQYTMSAYCY